MNMNLFFKGRSNGKTGGGVGMYIANDTNYRVRDDLSVFNSSMESIFIEITNNKAKNIVIGVIYRPPKSPIRDFLENFESVVNKINLGKKECYLLGDYNLDLLKTESNHLIGQFLDTLYSSYFTPLISKPTRITTFSSSLIDNIFTNVTESENSISGLLYSDISDHLPIFHIRQKEPSFVSRNSNYTRTINNKNISRFVNNIIDYQWKISNGSPDEAYNSFCKQFSNLYNDCFPVKQTTRKNDKNKPWLTTGLAKSIKIKNSLYKKFIKSPTTTNHKKFKQYRNKLTSLIRTCKKQYYSSLLEKSKSNIKETWKILNEILKTQEKKKTYPKSFKIKDEQVSDQNQISNEFAEYFSNLGRNLSKNIPDTNIDINEYLLGDFQNSCFFNPTTPEEISKIIMTLKNKASCGFDEINIKVVKAAAPFISSILSDLINKSIESGEIPNSLKIAKVIPLYKSGDKDLITNYRPVSILPCISKVYEKVVYNRLTSYIDKNNILNQNQYGFRSNRSTSMAILDFVEKVSTSLDNGFTTTGIFLDLSKAFDTINHEILLKKLNFYGIRGKPLKWIENYLQDRKQFVDFNGTHSEMFDITCGVPQGSILGPLLFLIYINDVCNTSKIVHFTLFADDTNILYTSKDLNNYNSKLNEELKKLSLWFKTNKLSVNIKKTNYMIFRNSKRKKTTQSQIQIDGTMVDKVDETKFLGIIIDDQLKWKSHISHICSKVSKGIGIIWRIRYLLPTSAVKSLYYTLIYPYLHYGNTIWGCTYETNLERLSILQKRVVRLISNSPYNAHTNPLFKAFSILKLKDITTLNVASFMYLYTKCQLPETFKHVFKLNSEIHQHNTRQSQNYHTVSRKTKLSQFSISSMGPLIWNTYKKFLDNCKTIYKFKKIMKEELISKYID